MALREKDLFALGWTRVQLAKMCIRDRDITLVLFRQGAGYFWGQLGVMPVSYTHLDVYKRQRQSRDHPPCGTGRW